MPSQPYPPARSPVKDSYRLVWTAGSSQVAYGILLVSRCRPMQHFQQAAASIPCENPAARLRRELGGVMGC